MVEVNLLGAMTATGVFLPQLHDGGSLALAFSSQRSQMWERISTGPLERCPDRSPNECLC
jgi:hypothetical protein